MPTIAPNPYAQPAKPVQLLPDTHARRSPGLTLAIIILATVACLSGFFGGPALGDHEALVAQAARTMRLTGDWVLPMFLGEPWFRKPPLAYWLVAGLSYLFPNDPATHLPVTAAVARLPSALAGLGTILLLWKLASAMFGPRTGRVAAVLASSTILFLLYSPNATVEMVLTFCCVLAYLHFWYVATAREKARRILHITLFYVALGMGMLAKGPAPMAMVGLPLAIWWFTHRPFRVVARRGPRGLKMALACFARGFWPRTVQSFTRLWLFPGLLLFAVFFVPWMLAVTHRVPTAWDEWNSQYLQRAQGDYLDSQDRAPWYYLMYIVGFLVPWFFLIPEGVLAPWLKRYARLHRPLLYAGLWAFVAILVMSLEPFKKPYYILPALPGLILLMAVIAERFYSTPVQAKPWMWRVLAVVAGLLIVAVIVGSILVARAYPAVAGRLTVIMALSTVALVVAGAIHIKNRPWVAFAALALTTIIAFQSVWHSSGQLLDNLERAEALAKALSGLPKDARILWGDGRPDSRLGFYFDRMTGYMLHPSEIVALYKDRKSAQFEIKLKALGQAQHLMRGSEPVYLIFERESWDAARRQNLVATEIASVSRDDPTGKSKGGKSKKDWVVVTNRP